MVAHVYRSTNPHEGKAGLLNKLRTLEVDKFFDEPAHPTSNIRYYIYKLRPMRFATKRVIENGAQVIRVWRTE